MGKNIFTIFLKFLPILEKLTKNNLFKNKSGKNQKKKIFQIPVSLS